MNQDTANGSVTGVCKGAQREPIAAREEKKILNVLKVV
jgi:hypothetical protein